MRKKILWITETAVMMALLITLQALTKPAGQLVTGSCVNAILAVSALVGGLSCGLTVAVLSPIFAFLFGIAPQVLTVPVIMLGNAAYVALLWVLSRKGKQLWWSVVALLVAAVAKFAVLYLLVTKVVCGVLANGLLEKGLLKQPMLTALPATFSTPQLITALIGGAVALLVVPVLRKALKKN